MVVFTESLTSPPGQIVHSFRINFNISLEVFSKNTEISVDDILKIESGELLVGWVRAKKIAKYLGLDPHVLVQNQLKALKE